MSNGESRRGQLSDFIRRAVGTGTRARWVGRRPEVFPGYLKFQYARLPESKNHAIREELGKKHEGGYR